MSSVINGEDFMKYLKLIPLIFILFGAGAAFSLVGAQTASAAILSVQVQLEGRPSVGNYPLEITVSNGTRTFPVPTSTNASGQFEIGSLPPGAYMLRVLPRGYLAVSIPLNLIAGPNKLVMGPFRVGDANLDNQISMMDFAMLSSSFNQRSGTSGYDARVDFNGDGQITLVDFSLLSANHGQRGADPLNIAPQVPAQVLDLRLWKITLPLPNPSNSSSPWEILQPQLGNFQSAPWFQIAPDGGILFRAPVNGTTTSGSSYPRSELREMTGDGRQLASWSSTSGTHTMFIDQAITAVPATKRHIVVGQIHDSSDDVIVIRLEYPNLHVDLGGDNVAVLDPDYTLGERFTVQFVVSGGRTSIFYNGSSTPAHTLTRSYSRAYFKAGAYTQSNCSRENGAALCNANNYGEVIIYGLGVTHQ
jgi:hypothetical protein